MNLFLIYLTVVEYHNQIKMIILYFHAALLTRQQTSALWVSGI